jgi:uncharacterized protein YecE (DUF72 family)
VPPDLPESPPPRIRVGIGGGNYEPWRNHFYPAGLAHREELAHASRRVTAIEINSTYYGVQKPATFAKWRDETPGDFIFSLKASRYATNRRVLAEAGDSVRRFIHSGLAELGPKLGPIVWQFAPTKVFDPDDFAAFLDLLPARVDGLSLRHVLDVRHASFMSPHYLGLARERCLSTVFTDSPDFPSFADETGDLVYARLMCARPDVPTGYPLDTLARWAEVAKTWAAGRTPEGAPLVEPGGSSSAEPKARDVFIYFINGAKENAPAAAQALLARCGLRTDEPR